MKDKDYRKAEEKIEQARREGATELYLGSMELTELPESVRELGQLERSSQ